MFKPALYKPRLNFQNTLSGVESQSAHKHSWSGCLHRGEPSASIKERLRQDTSPTTLDFICHVREGIIGNLPFPRNCGRPFSYFKSIHNKVHIISPNFTDEKSETH